MMACLPSTWVIGSNEDPVVVKGATGRRYGVFLGSTLMELPPTDPGSAPIRQERIVDKEVVTWRPIGDEAHVVAYAASRANMMATTGKTTKEVMTRAMIATSVLSAIAHTVLWPPLSAFIAAASVCFGLWHFSRGQYAWVAVDAVWAIGMLLVFGFAVYIHRLAAGWRDRR